MKKEKLREQCEEALQLLLKLSNKPHFIYLNEVKEIALIIHTLASSLPTDVSGVTEYELKNDKILKNGHTMFLEDVVTDLKRLAYLESMRSALQPIGSSKDLLSHAFKSGRISTNTSFEQWYSTFVSQSNTDDDCEKYYQKLFNHLNDVHGLIPLQTEMDDIISIVSSMQPEKNKTNK